MRITRIKNINSARLQIKLKSFFDNFAIVKQKNF
mgnify:CR=1 FL=1